MQLKKCSTCGGYTLKDMCSNCGLSTKDVVYRFKEIRDAPKDSAQHFTRLRRNK